MAPEVINSDTVTRQADVFSAAVVLWEVLTRKKLFDGATEQERLTSIVSGKYPSPRQFNSEVPQALERVLGRALRLDPNFRYSTALEFAIDIERAGPLASQRVVGAWVRRLAAGALDQRKGLILEIESSTVVQPCLSVAPPARPKTGGRITIDRPSIVTQ